MAQSPENLWLCGDGIYRATPDSLQKWEHERDAPPEYTLSNRADGMNSTQCSGGFRNLAVTNDGRLWVATEQDIAMLEFSRLRHTDRKPAIFIESIVSGKTVQAPGRELILPAGTNHVELHFDTIELASPEAIRLQYRLDSVDREWLDADSSATAVYSGIPPGTHQFHVRACNSDGVWDQAGIFYNVTQKPYFYETTWFRLSALAVIGLLVAGIYRVRVGRIAHEFNVRLEERVNERMRIARELHDTLLQSFQGALLYFQAGVNLLPDRPDNARAKEKLEGAMDQAAQAIDEGRDAVQDLRSSNIETNDLATALKTLAGELAPNETNQSAPAIDVQGEGVSRDLHPILRDEVYRIAAEALRNAFRHAQAKHIEVEIHYEVKQLRLRVRDDGKGMDANIVAQKGRPGHYGLRGMRERAKAIGGNLELWSNVEHGTEVELTIPANTAYAGTAQRRSWFARKGNAVNP